VDRPAIPPSLRRFRYQGRPIRRPAGHRARW
jgi:hypothetical protein